MCEATLDTLLTTVTSNCTRWQGNGRTVQLQHNHADNLKSMNCDVTCAISITKFCFYTSK